MKAKVIIENGLTQIELTPDNDFEKDVIEKSKDLNPNCDVNFSYGKESYYTMNKTIKLQSLLRNNPHSKQ